MLQDHENCVCFKYQLFLLIKHWAWNDITFQPQLMKDSLIIIDIQNCNLLFKCEWGELKSSKWSLHGISYYFFKFQLTFSNANGEFKMTTAWRKLFFEDYTINFLSMNYFIVKLYIFYFQPTILFLWLIRFFDLSKK